MNYGERDGSAVWRRAQVELYELAVEANMAIINVPPEKDELDKLQLERAMIEIFMSAPNPLNPNNE